MARLSRRQALSFTGLTLASAVLAACAGGAPPAPTAAPVRPATAAQPTAAGQSAGPAKPTPGANPTSAAKPTAAAPAATNGQTATLHLLAWGDPQETKARGFQIQAFEADNPTIKMIFDHTPTADYLTKLNTMLASGDVPDVIYIGNGDMWRYASLGSLLPLTPLIQRDNFDTTQIYEKILKLYEVDGVQYGFPADAPSQQLFHNTSMFQATGAALPSYDWKDPNWNWNAFLESAKKLTQPAANGQAAKYGFVVQTGFRAWWIWVVANGGQMFNADNTKCLLDQDPSVEAFQFLADLIHKYKVAPRVDANTTQLPYDQFTGGRLGMLTYWPALELTRQNMKVGQWDVAPHPQGKVGKASSGGGTGHHIGKASKYPEQAWTFLKWTLGTKGANIWVQYMGIVSPVKAIDQTDAFLQPGKPPKHIKVFLDGLDYLAADPRHPKFPQVINAVSKNLDDLWNGNKNAKQALTAAVQDANKAIASS